MCKKLIVASNMRLLTFIKNNKLLAIILILAAFLRFVGTNPGYNKFHSDEGVSYSAAISMIKNGNLDPLRYDYPALVPLINFIFFKFLFIPLFWLKYYLTHIPQIIDGIVQIKMSSLEEKRLFQLFILGEREINALFWGRYVTALFSVINVFLIYLVTKNLFNKNTALIAAFLLSVNFRAITNSHVGLPDIYNAFFVLLTFYSLSLLLKHPSKKNYLFTGISVGLSISVKYQIFAVIPFLLAHLFLSWDKSFKKTFQQIFNKKLFISIVSIPTVFVLLNPYFLVYLPEVLKIVNGVAMKYGMGNKSFLLYPYSYLFHFDYGPIEFILILVGTIFSLKLFPKKTLLILSLVIPFFFVMTYYSIGGFYVRNFITITPLLLIFAAILISFCFDKLEGKKFLPLKLIILLIIVYIPFSNALIHDYYYIKPWVYDDIVEKSEKILPNNFTIATHPFHEVSKTKQFNQVEFEALTSHSLAEFREQGADFALANLDLAGNSFYFWMTVPYKRAIEYWNKPVEKMNNTFWGLSINEMMNYVLADSYKPWQSPDASMFLIKIPTLSKELLSDVIKQYSFDSGEEDMQRVYSEDSSTAQYLYDRSEGYTKKGSLKYVPGLSDVGIMRITSAPITVQSHRMYIAEGYMKSDHPVEHAKRNGFLRMDFYTNKNELLLAGDKVAVSVRYEGSDWKKVQAFSSAPENAKYLRVSFQIAGQSTFPIWVDDLTIKQSQNVINEEQQYKTIPFADYRDLLYPNSHGNL